MTIGIGASGPGAGQAVFDALRAAEAVGRGSIGGYAVFCAIDATGAVYYAQTQRGGTKTLFTQGESTGTEPPELIAEAPLAAVMSSGPDRPDPLIQFLPADGAVGMVTGHRLPNGRGADGQRLNQGVLDRMRAGASPDQALTAVIAANPQADAGMIALNASGQIALQNSPRVAVRPDQGSALIRDAGKRAAVAVLHNAIQPQTTLAALVAEIAMNAMLPPTPEAGRITVRAGTPLAHAETAAVEVDMQAVARRVLTTDPALLTGRHNCAALYLDSQVLQSGRLLGLTSMEPNVIVENGRIVSLSGQKRVDIPFHATPRAGTGQ